MGWARARNTAVRSTLTAIRKAYNVQRTRSLSSYLDFLADFAGFVAKRVVFALHSTFKIQHSKLNIQHLVLPWQ